MSVGCCTRIRKERSGLVCYRRSFASECGLPIRASSAYPLVAFRLFNKPHYGGRRPDVKQIRSLLTTSPYIDLAYKPAGIRTDLAPLVYCGKYVFFGFFLPRCGRL